MKIFDCITYFNEKTLADLRFNILDKLWLTTPILEPFTNVSKVFVPPFLNNCRKTFVFCL